MSRTFATFTSEVMTYFGYEVGTYLQWQRCWGARIDQFDPEQEQYVERLEQFFEANETQERVKQPSDVLPSFRLRVQRPTNCCEASYPQ